MFKDTTAKTPDEYIAMLKEPRRSEIQQLHNLIVKTLPQLKPHIRSGIIGYGTYHYKYASGREGDWFIIGLASNQNYISVYVQGVDGDQYLAEKHKSAFPKANIGKSCIRFKHLTDIDLIKLKVIIVKGAKALK